MKYNSVENADKFITEQMTFCKDNGYSNFTIWSNGKELQAVVDDNDITTILRRAELKQDGYWKAMQFERGCRVEC